MQSQRDVELNLAAIATIEQDYKSARDIVQKLLRLDPNDIEALLLFSIVIDNEEYSIQALQRVLQIDPEHPLAFVELARKKSALPTEIPSPQAPKPKAGAAIQARKHSSIPPTLREKGIAKLESSPALVEPKKRKRKRNWLEPVIAGTLILACLCIGIAVFQGLLSQVFIPLG